MKCNKLQQLQQKPILTHDQMTVLAFTPPLLKLYLNFTQTLIKFFDTLI